jgi:hypothetical protein
MDKRRLAPLGALDVERQASGAPDVRGWEVVAELDGRRIGEVAELLGEPGSGRVRFLDVRLSPGAVAGGPHGSPGTTSEQLRAEERGRGVEHAALREKVPVGDTLLGDENPADGAGWDSPEVRREAAELASAQGGGRERHVLVPVGRARIDRPNRRVVVEGLASADAAGLHGYVPGETAAAEEETVRRFAGLPHSTEAGVLAADHGLFDEDHFYGSAGPAGPAAPDLPPGEEEPAEAGLRPDAPGLRHERDVLPRR